MLSKEDINLIVSQFKQKLQKSWQGSEEDFKVLMTFIESGHETTDLVHDPLSDDKQAMKILLDRSIKKPKKTFKLSAAISEKNDNQMLRFLICSVALEFLCKVFQDQQQKKEDNKKLTGKWLVTQFDKLKEQWLEIEKQTWNVHIQPKIDQCIAILESERRAAVKKIVALSFLTFVLILTLPGSIVLLATSFTYPAGTWIILLDMLIIACGGGFIVKGVEAAEKKKNALRTPLADLKKLMPRKGKQRDFEENTKFTKTALVKAGAAQEVSDFITNGLDRLSINHEEINKIISSMPKKSRDQLKELDRRIAFLQSKDAFLAHQDRVSVWNLVSGFVCMFLSLPLLAASMALLLDPVGLGMNEEGNLAPQFIPIPLAAGFLPIIIGIILTCHYGLARPFHKRRESMDDFKQILSWIKEDSPHLPAENSYRKIQREFIVDPEKALGEIWSAGVWGNAGCRGTLEDRGLVPQGYGSGDDCDCSEGCTSCCDLQSDKGLERRMRKSMKSLIEYYSQKRSSLQSSDASDQASKADHARHGKEEEETLSQEMGPVFR